MRPGRRLIGLSLAVLLAVLLATAGCGAADGSGGPGGAGAAGAGPVTVFAAASLTEVFTELGADFEAAHPGTTVTFSFAGSSALAAQINEGAPADVFAAANRPTMATVTEAGNTDGAPTTFARNQLVIAVAPGNPHGVTGLADLADPRLKVALCAEQVPCGAATRTALAAAGVALTPVTFEQDVKAALSKLILGEVDAALVYRTDATAAGDAVVAVEFPESASALNDYPIAVVAGAPNPAGARAFVAYIQAEPAQAVLAAVGFQRP